MRASLVIYTKPGRPGHVKTRLVGTSGDGVTAEQAAELHLAFLHDLVEEMSEGPFDLRLAWALDPGEAVPNWTLDDGRRVPGSAQRGADLGERLWRGLDAEARVRPWVAAVGSDHPTLRRAVVEEAFARLEAGAPVVLGPAEDGGYFLVAVSREALSRRLFEDVPWSTDAVLETTLERCRELGLEPELLAPGRDVDTPADLARLVTELRQDAELCPHTRKLLAAWGRLESARGEAGEGSAEVRGPRQEESRCEC